MPIKTLKEKQIKKIANNKSYRTELTKQSFYHFLGIYLNHIFYLEFAPKHKDIINALDSLDDLDKYVSIIGFRGCSKSTLAEAFTIWSLINSKHNFIVYIGNTLNDAKMSIANIKNEIEENKLLRSDFNIVIENKTHRFTDKWTEGQITVRDTTIIAKSRGQKIRGAKFKQARIDLIIGDDLEEVKDTESSGKRKKHRRWFFGEVIPATKQGVLSDDVKVVMIGNKVHRDCLIVRFSKSELVKSIEFPIIDKDGNSNWKAVFPNKESIEKQKKVVMIEGEGLGSVIWAREYLMKDVDEEGQPVSQDDISYYSNERLTSNLRSLRINPKRAGNAIDLAISEKQTADFTAMVSGVIAEENGKDVLYIRPKPVNNRMDMNKTIETAKTINRTLPKGSMNFVEDVGYQKAVIKEMSRRGLKNVKGIRPISDKRARLETVAIYIRSGLVRFPKEGCKDLIDQLLGFGIERHDDLVDALVYLIFGLLTQEEKVRIGVGKGDVL